MIAAAANACSVLVALAMGAALYRIVRGPSLPDRVLAADLLASCIIAILLISGMTDMARDRLDAAMVIGLVSFFSTVLFARYLRGGRPID